MPLSRSKIERTFKVALDEVHREASESGLGIRIKAIQFLLPDTHHLGEIKRFTYCEIGTSERFDKAVTDFVFDGKPAKTSDGELQKVERSLYYLTFKAPFKYISYLESLITDNSVPRSYELPDEQFGISNGPIRIEGEDRERLMAQNRHKVWNIWGETFKKWGYGSSTLWTYILMRRADRTEAISSAFIIFDGSLTHSNNAEDPQYKFLSCSSKQMQEALYELTLELFRSEITLQATRAAISQVMARNMSHNIGSHVSYRATNSQVKRRAREHKPDINTNTPVFADWLDYFGDRLDKYEIYRNEYLSDFDQSPKFLKFYKDLVLPFCENMFVMDNIAAGEHLHYESTNKNKLLVRCWINGEEIKAEYPSLSEMFPDSSGKRNNIVYPDNFPYLLKHKDFSDQSADKNSLESAINHKVTVGADDVEVCIHSEQAFYSILENFIRNSAKHNPKDGSDLVVYLDLRTEPTHYKLHIFDNRSQALPEVLFSRTEPLGICQKIKQSLLDNLGRPRRANWGFADMKINSFLLFNSVDDFDDTRLHENFRLIAVGDDGTTLTCVDDDTITSLDKGSPLRFGYQIKLSLARKVLWIGDFNLDNKEVLESEGLQIVLNLDNISEELQKIEGLSSFQFVLINEELNHEKYLKFEEKLPGRVIVLQSRKGQSALDKPSLLTATAKDVPTVSMYAMLKWCWERWLTREGRRINLYLYFENPTVADNWVGIRLQNGLKTVTVNSLQEQELLSDEVINIVYNHHGGAFKQALADGSLKLECPTDEEGNDLMNFITKHSIIFFGQGSEDFAALNYPPVKPEDKEMMIYQLMDAATTNVFVIDERISGYANQTMPSEFSPNGIRIGTEELRTRNWYMYAAGKLFVAHEIKNRNAICFIGKVQAKQEKLGLDITNDRINLYSDIAGFDAEGLRKDVLIIHRTYLDKAKIGMDPKLFINMAKRQFGSVFITSGGGYPHNLEVRCRFIPFSTLESCVNSRLSKNKLNNVLKSNIKLNQ